MTAPEAGTTALVVVNYRTLSWLRKCLASLPSADRARLLLVVVDNSPQPEAEALREDFPEAVLLRSDRNLGFAGGCNLGIRYALEEAAETVLLLNPDTQVVPADNDTFLEPLLDVLHNNPAVAIVTPTVRSLDPPHRVLFAGGRMSWWAGGPVHLRHTGRPAEPWRPTEFASGCAMLVRSAALRDVGLFDESYFLYFEDADLVQRCRAAGWTVAWVPSSTVLHQEAAAVDRKGVEHARLYSRNRLWFLRRWAPRAPWLGYLAYTLLLKLPASFLLLGPRRGWAFAEGVRQGLTDEREAGGPS